MLHKNQFHFFSYLARMKLIDRWSLMRCTQRENVQEHSLQVAIIAHALCVIKNKYFEGSVDPAQIALAAIFHDATEVLTGDLPTPVKYFNNEIRSAYLTIEDHAVEQLLKLLPEDLKNEYRDLLVIPEQDVEAQQIIKSADTIAAYIKCLEEETAGNHEFSRAKKSIESKLEKLKTRPEVDHFMKHFATSFTYTLDDISRPLEL